MSNSVLPAEIPARLQAIAAATERLLATVEAMPDESFRQPSALPDWSKAHVVAHLALNAEGHVRALAGLSDGDPRPMYASNERRDADVDELAGGGPDTIRDRLRAGATAFADVVRRVPEAAWSGTVDRVPGGEAVAATATVVMRHREIEIHHADLGAGYDPDRWPEPFVGELLDALTVDLAGFGPFSVTATDLGRSWHIGGATGPEVRGTGAGLGWWLVGRGTGADLRCDAGELPTVGPWRSRRRK